MADGLAYFKKVYNDIPNWVQIMYDYNPKMLDYYTDIRGEAFKDSELSAKEKDEFIASMNAGRLYKRSMLYHTQAAIIKGSQIGDLIEYFLVAYVYSGKDALELSLAALENALIQKEKTVNERKNNYATDKEVFEQIIEWTNDSDNTLVKKVYTLLDDSKNHNSPEIIDLIMSDGKVSRKKKYLNLIGQYITELRGNAVGPLIEKARNIGVTEAELADLGYIVMITAGIPSWFELSDHLNSK
ncbi:carboxymuconolactone decarboxylase family protein [Proteiniborus sp. MB09-C3]|uniref:carboxymuconolactone decarboxylase family protein n=1 Tax=Proteiniborus sp. MB09-C3 TaxID=3050072 RepID=UPI002553DD46|nr:carboxymuconolactone decarboxylase family protein [Proteiniborus sp. MB09-C3]WIV12290.1 carboxymuconolactone decarboxylase family protein [Proteiniborus sp. MB09-C3]